MGFFVVCVLFALLLCGIWYKRRKTKLRYTPAPAPLPMRRAEAGPDPAVMQHLAQHGAVEACISALPALLTRMAREPDNAGLVAGGAAACRTVYDALSPDALSRCRRISDMGGVDWTHFDPDVWEAQCAPEEYHALLCMGTLHSSGYFRERCLRRLLGTPEALPYILLRLNDWVPQIRHLAASTLCYLLQDAPMPLLLDCQVLLERLLRCSRCRQDETFRPWEVYPILTERWRQEPGAVLASPPSVRNRCYGALLVEYRVRSAMGNTDALDALTDTLLAGEHSRHLRSCLKIMYLRFSGSTVPEERLRADLCDRDGIVRQCAAARRLKQSGLWEDFPELLIDPSRQIRELAAFILQKSGFDCLGYVRRRLPEPGALLALGELGTAEEIPLAALYLAADKTRSEALVALSRLHADEAASHVFAALTGTDRRAARTAFRLIPAHRFRYAPAQMYGACIRSEDPVLRHRLLLLLCRQGGWDTFPALMRLYTQVSDPAMQHRILLALSQRNLYLPVRPALAADIREAAQACAQALPGELTASLLADLARVETH